MKIKNLFTKSVSLIVLGTVCFAVNAAENGRGRVSMMPNLVNASGGASRMPVMPVVTINTIGNPAVHTVAEPHEINPGIVPTPTPTPEPEPEPDPDPEPECEDGGVPNTAYTVDMCMTELQACVNSGGVEGGMHGLFNEEYFHGVLVGNLRICQNVIDKCLAIRVDCKNVYKNFKMVWLDFKIKVLQPEYYNFVLFKTGLTPNQARKTCINIGGRWDAVNADCIVCVTAYNKETPIKNSWLFGIAGDERAAEACMPTGSTFTCNKDLFGFSLMNDTATVAATAIPGGAIVGGTTGGIIAAAKQKKAMGDPCSSKDFRQRLGKQIQTSRNDKVLKTYLFSEGRDGAGDYSDTDEGHAKALLDNMDFYNMDKNTCDFIMGLYSKAKLYEDVMAACREDREIKYVSDLISSTVGDTTVIESGSVTLEANGQICYTESWTASVNCVTPDQTVRDEAVQKFNRECMFIPLRLGLTVANENNPLCSHSGKCRTLEQTQNDLNRLRGLLNDIEVAGYGKAPSVGKGILVGALTGAGVGGLATGITAIIEKSNISCRVQNGLGSVGLGKSFTIDSLKNWYVKRGLNLPDTVLANTPVVDKNSWGVACSEFQGKQDDCQNASIIYKHNNKREVVSYACMFVGSMCLMNTDVAALYGIQ